MQPGPDYGLQSGAVWNDTLEGEGDGDVPGAIQQSYVVWAGGADLRRTESNPPVPVNQDIELGRNACFSGGREYLTIQSFQGDISVSAQLKVTSKLGICKAPMERSSTGCPFEVRTMRARAQSSLQVDSRSDLLLSAMACDLTRVATLSWGRGGCNHRFTWLGKQLDIGVGLVGIHAAAHDENNPTMRALLVQMHAWYAMRLSAIIDRLKATPEGNGTMMDNTLIVWFNELGQGGTHTLSNVPWVLVGNAQKQLKTNRLVSVPGKPNNAMLVSLCKIMGLSATDTFGDPQFGSGPLPGLL